ncbi:hypothetical protein HRG_014510 [Hirsutella rhossiliensis]
MANLIFITTCVLGSYLFQCVLAVLCNKPIVKDNHVGGIVSALSRGKHNVTKERAFLKNVNLLLECLPAHYFLRHDGGQLGYRGAFNRLAARILPKLQDTRSSDLFQPRDKAIMVYP